MEQNANEYLGNPLPKGNHFPENAADLSAQDPARDRESRRVDRATECRSPDTADNFEHISEPVRRVVARALKKARLRELGLLS